MATPLAASDTQQVLFNFVKPMAVVGITLEDADLPSATAEATPEGDILRRVTEAALAEWIEARGGNPFMEIAVPDASLRLVQACGRLLRTEQDRGTITLLDRRVVTQRYGKAILNALPPFRREIA